MRLAIAIAALVACERRSPIVSCEQNLHGVWVTPTGERWMLLDNGASLEAYPLFPDGVDGGAPRLIDLHRAGALAGDVKRRYTRGADRCEARAPIRLTACLNDELQVVRADPQAPLAFAPCTWPQRAPSRAEHWKRE